FPGTGCLKIASGNGQSAKQCGINIVENQQTVITLSAFQLTWNGDVYSVQAGPQALASLLPNSHLIELRAIARPAEASALTTTLLPPGTYTFTSGHPDIAGQP